jgi:carotenoid cleavage dioxygenase-like enzyme
VAWTIDLTTGSVTEQQLDDRACEFPRVDDREVGLNARRGWVSSMPRHDDPYGAGALTVYDLASGTATTRTFDRGQVPSEGVFAPADEHAGGSGWLLAYVYDASRDARDLVVLNVDNCDGEPVGTVRLQTRVPYGFHGTWIADD